MWDFQAVGFTGGLREPKVWTGRFVGAGAAAPTVPTSASAPAGPVPNSGSTKVKVTYNATGNVTYAFSDAPFGNLQSYDWWVVSSNAHVKCTKYAPPTFSAGVWSFTVLTVYATNDTAVDLTTAEEIHFFHVSGGSG